jgi:hypothetical protein
MTKSPNTVICTDCGWNGDLQTCHWKIGEERAGRAPTGLIVDLRYALCPECHKLASLHVKIEPQS